jgi:hypothetical protein
MAQTEISHAYIYTVPEVITSVDKDRGKKEESYVFSDIWYGRARGPYDRSISVNGAVGPRLVLYVYKRTCNTMLPCRPLGLRYSSLFAINHVRKMLAIVHTR